jgi:hypothetical protein
MNERERESERERERERARENARETKRERERVSETQSHREREREKAREGGRETERERVIVRESMREHERGNTRVCERESGWQWHGGMHALWKEDSSMPICESCMMVFRSACRMISANPYWLVYICMGCTRAPPRVNDRLFQ